MKAPERIGNYLVFPAFASGASASVHLARLMRTDGFRRLSVLKRFHSALFAEPDALDRFLREARLSSRVRSPYVVTTLDIIPSDLALVMELVHGVTLARLMEEAHRTQTHLEPSIIVAIMGNVLRGLEAAHEATGEDGARLDLLHRDVAPQNVMVGSDGLARLLDFGVATALGERITASGEVRGTLAYIAPEQLRGQLVTRRADLFSAAVILWELLSEKRLRSLDREGAIENLDLVPAAPSTINPRAPAALDAIVMRALASDPSARHATAFALATELEAAVRPATPQEVARIVEKLAFDDLDRMRELIIQAEQSDTVEAPTTIPESAVPTNAPSVGTVVAGRYRVESVIGRGGMGVVVAARHLTLNQSVALKFLTRKTEPAAVERVLREARTAMRLTGDHVVRVFDAGIEQGAPYIVMEKLGGTDLKVVLAEEGPLPIPRVVTYGLELCEVLVEAHALGIVHRDLKPSNLFLSQTGSGQLTLKVLDFGIAKVAAEDESDSDHASLTETGVLLGSPGYMSPEQLRSAKNVDARTDVWAVGVVLYELLSGVHPFASTQTNETLARVMADEPTPLRKLRSEVPEGLARVVHECLRKNPDKRMPSAAALAHALEPFAPAGQTSTARIRRIAAQAGMVLSHRGPSSMRWRRTGAAVAVVGVAGLLALASQRRAPSHPTTGALAVDPITSTPVAKPPTVTSIERANDPVPGITSAVASGAAPSASPSLLASAPAPGIVTRGRKSAASGNAEPPVRPPPAASASAPSAPPSHSVMATASAEPAPPESTKRAPKGAADAGALDPDPSAAFE